MGSITEKEYYRKKIIEMVEEIMSERFIKMIYACAKTLYDEEKQENR